MSDTIFSYDIFSPEIQFLKKKDKRLSKVLDLVGPLTYQLHSDPYAFMVNTIMGQMLSNKGAGGASRTITQCV